MDSTAEQYELKLKVSRLKKEIQGLRRENAELRSKEKNQNALFEAFPIPLWMEDFSEVKDYIDRLKKKGIKNFEHYFDRRPEEVVEMSRLVRVINANNAALILHKARTKNDLLAGLQRIFADETMTDFKKEIIAVAGGGACLQFCTTVITLTGEKKFVSVCWRVLPGSEDTYSRVLVSTADITENKKAEAASYLTRFCFERASLSIIRHGSDGKVIDANEQACLSLGYSRNELCSLNVFDIDPWVNREKWKDLWDGMRDNGAITFEAVHRRKDGAAFPVEITANHIEFEGREFSVAFVKDIADRKKAERETKALQQQLVQAQKMEAVGQLAGGIAHDFNNLLQVILGNTQILLLGSKEGLPGYAHMKHIERASLRASDLIRRILTYSRKIESDLRSINLNNEVKQITAMLERTLPKMISIDVRLENGIRNINADAIQIGQILMNLAVNAQHAMPEGGTLTIETKNAVLDKKYCTSHLGAKAGEYVVLAVSDNGIGMDRETMDRMYDPFFTTKQVGQGSGLGLSMVYGIVKNHGGYITCYSEPGRGAAFTIYFPALCICRPHENADSHSDELRGGKETILIVDDNRAVLQFTENVVSSFGYKTLTADSGEEALRLYKADRGAIDLLVLDLDMPGMGGAKCLEELIRIDPGVKVVVASGLSPNGEVKKILESGVGTFVGKPFQVSQIMPRIRDVLDW